MKVALMLLVATSLTGVATANAKHKGKKKLDTEVVLEDRIQIRIHGLESNQGWVICRLYDEKGWLKKAKETVTGEIDRRATTCLFENIKPGTYGVAAFHDENKNGEPDGAVGKPTEGVCASNNPKIITKKPEFKKVKFTYAGGVLTKSVRMRYP